MRLIRSCLFFAAIPFFFFVSSAQEIDPETNDGKALYEAWCSSCHGLDGTGPIGDLELGTQVPDLEDCSFNSREPRKDWRAVILHGGPARRLSMTMPAWSEALTEEQADAIIAHVKTLCSEQCWPQGELNFRRTHGTAKAFPENEALLIPTFTEKNKPLATTRLVYERRVGPLGQWEVSVPFLFDLGPSRTTGIGDIDSLGSSRFFTMRFS